jgi:hypothetical protein
MATPTQFVVTHKELITLLIKHAGVHEGRWALAINFGFGPGNFGPTPETLSPGAVVVVNQILIQKEPPDGPPMPDALIADAAQVNPAPKHSAQERTPSSIHLGKRKRAPT